MINTNILLTLIYTININWGNIIDPIGRMFNGGNVTDPVTGNISHVTGMFEGDPALFGAFLFIAFLLLTLIFGLGLLIGMVVLIPASFAIFQYIPDLRIIIGIMAGLLFGLALHKLIRR
jgi:hypothetical protein